MTTRVCNSTNSDSTSDESFWSSGGKIEWDAHRIGWVVCGAAAILTVLISLLSVSLHVSHYTTPRLQRQTVRVILMPPVYAVVAFFSYRFFRDYTYYSVSVTTYEAVTLSAFMLLLVGMVGASHGGRGLAGGNSGGGGFDDIEVGDDKLKAKMAANSGFEMQHPSSLSPSSSVTFLHPEDKITAPTKGSLLSSPSALKRKHSTILAMAAEEKERERQAVLRVLREKEKRRMPFPFLFWRFRPSKPYFMYSLKWSVLQYVLLRPMISIIAVVCEYYQVLCPQTYSIYFAEVYLDAVDFVSISVALYGLIVFYMVTKDELKGQRPLAKFLGIKLIVIFTFYQTWMFGILQDHGVIKASGTWTATNVTDGLSALCTSVEMVLFSAYMLWAYSYREYVDPARPGMTGWPTAGRAIWDTINLGDMAMEIGRSFVFFWRWMAKKPGTRAGEADERTEFDRVFVPDHAPQAYAYDATRHNSSISAQNSPYERLKDESSGYFAPDQRDLQDPFSSDSERPRPLAQQSAPSPRSSPRIRPPSFPPTTMPRQGYPPLSTSATGYPSFEPLPPPSPSLSVSSGRMRVMDVAPPLSPPSPPRRAAADDGYGGSWDSGIAGVSRMTPTRPARPDVGEGMPIARPHYQLRGGSR